ncbi:MAG: hypothetical protein ACLUD0_07345 [Eubacterium ramulus]
MTEKTGQNCIPFLPHRQKKTDTMVYYTDFKTTGVPSYRYIKYSVDANGNCNRQS